MDKDYWKTTPAENLKAFLFSQWREGSSWKSIFVSRFVCVVWPQMFEPLCRPTAGVLPPSLDTKDTPAPLENSFLERNPFNIVPWKEIQIWLRLVSEFSFNYCFFPLTLKQTLQLQPVCVLQHIDQFSVIKLKVFRLWSASHFEFNMTQTWKKRIHIGAAFTVMTVDSSSICNMATIISTPKSLNTHVHALIHTYTWFFYTYNSKCECA